MASEITLSWLVHPGKPAFHTSTRGFAARSRVSRRRGQVAASSGASSSKVVDPPDSRTRAAPSGLIRGRSGER